MNLLCLLYPRTSSQFNFPFATTEDTLVPSESPWRKDDEFPGEEELSDDGIFDPPAVSFLQSGLLLASAFEFFAPLSRHQPMKQAGPHTSLNDHHGLNNTGFPKC